MTEFRVVERELKDGRKVVSVIRGRQIVASILLKNEKVHEGKMACLIEKIKRSRNIELRRDFRKEFKEDPAVSILERIFLDGYRLFAYGKITKQDHAMINKLMKKGFIKYQEGTYWFGATEFAVENLRKRKTRTIPVKIRIRKKPPAKKEPKKPPRHYPKK